MALNKRKALKELVKELEKNYLLQHACNKLGLTRSTIYRWMRENEEFAISLRASQAVGRRYMSDYVESKLFKNIEDQDQRAIEFWLKNNNERYRSHEKAMEQKIDSLKLQLRESQAALAAYGSGDLLMDRFVDWKRVSEYMDSPEWQENEIVRKGILRGTSLREIEVLDQVGKILTQKTLAEYAIKAGILPDENEDPAD